MSNMLPKAYWEGADAFLEGKEPDANPYPKHSKNWLWWRRGYIGW